MGWGGLPPLAPHRTVLSQDTRNRRRTMDPPISPPQGVHGRADRGTAGDDVIHHDAQPFAPVLGSKGIAHPGGSLIAVQSGQTSQIPLEGQCPTRQNPAPLLGSLPSDGSHRVLTAGTQGRAMRRNRNQPHWFIGFRKDIDASSQNVR